MKYELKEMLWEFTLSCNKNCKYCGSKEFLNNSKDKEIDRKHIAKEIAALKPNEITFTGGEPSTLIKELEECAIILNKRDVSCKVLTNGNLFKNKLEKKFDDLFVCYGLSINEEKDIEDAIKILSNIPREKTTIVTNFGSHNIGVYDKIMKFAMFFPTWQVQLTMGNEFQLDLDEMKRLQDKLIGIKKDLLNVVIADNFNCNQCLAGSTCCSITWNGDVVPCLSYRAWKNNMMCQGNVFKKTLSKIWNEEFQFYRNRKFFPCCKDITGINKIQKEKEATYYPFFPDDNKNTPLRKDITFVYGVVKPNDKDWTPPVISVYGVINPSI